ncbi:IFR1 [Candida pseudojiufengensis]|uniref:IFR1 n=1 Tax=Candida pseudojiufengensis TaxID=497109 RepID=UPI0022253E91|nr:IFR1 [Candida pseudojiufengensis]KAI5965552.1 IFR1 [Candida pseudojiufengensis]
MKAVVSTGETDPLTTIKNLSIPQITDDQILIKSHSFAINPTDWKALKRNREKDIVVGSDVSGKVEEVGSNVKEFKKGDYISSFVTGNISKTNSAFAEYVAVSPKVSIKYDHLVKDPSNSDYLKSGRITTFDGAASVSLGLVTVALAYSYSLKIKENKKPNDFILIWGGSTATGILAIQLAKLVFDLKVVTTASPKNHEFLKSLGADYVFDYNDENVVDKIKETANGNLHFALDTIAEPETFQKVYDSTSNTSGKIFLDSLLFLDSNSIKLDPNRDNNLIHYGKTLASFVLIKEKRFGDLLLKAPEDINEYYDPFWFEILPKYIGQLKHANLRILPDGFQSVNEGFSLSKKGVSNEKLVFSI